MFPSRLANGVKKIDLQKSSTVNSDKEEIISRINKINMTIGYPSDDIDKSISIYIDTIYKILKGKSENNIIELRKCLEEKQELISHGKFSSPEYSEKIQKLQIKIQKIGEKLIAELTSPVDYFL